MQEPSVLQIDVDNYGIWLEKVFNTSMQEHQHVRRQVSQISDFCKTSSSSVSV